MHTHNNHIKHLFFFISLLLLFSPFTYSQQCLEKPLFDNEPQLTDCPQVNETSHIGKSKTKNLSLDNLDTSNGNMIQLLFKCDQNQTTCDKAKIAFNNVISIIENTFDLKVPIVINASFVQLCGTFTTCTPGKPQPLGAAGPARFIPLPDTDGTQRLFAQSLVKQFQLPQHPAFSNVDITAGFNSESTTFWFRGDPPIGQDQVDFEIVLAHEFLHGLGFLTSWDEYVNPSNPSAITPSPSFTTDNGGTVTFNGFQEYSFDKHLVLTKDNSSLTLVTNQLNQFAKGNPKFASRKDFIAQFSKSPEFQIAKGMLTTSVTADSIAFVLPDDGSNVLMETSLSPYAPGSSLTHVDFATLSNTTDFLMRFKAPRQVTLDDLTSINGNDPTYTNPIGPKTIRVLQAMGYVLKNFYS